MNKLRLGKTGLIVNRLAFGGIPIQRVNEAKAIETVLHSIENGIDFIDTARAYTNSEARIGKALQQTGKKVTIATKSQARTAEEVLKDVQTSLKELQTDYIDLYQVHGIRDETDYEKIIGPGGALEGLKTAKQQGLIGHIGATSHNLDVVDLLLDDGHFETIMICFSFLEPLALERVIPKAIAKDVGVIAMKPMSGGVIENPTLALKYVLGAPDVLVLVGIEHSNLFDENWKVFQGEYSLSRVETSEIETIRQQFDKTFCRRCDYCLPCTADIPIQMVLGIRSSTKRMGLSILKGGFLTQALEKARDCTECGDCETRCPYELPIPQLIKKNLAWAEEQLRG